MSFFGKFKAGATPLGQSGSSPSKKDPNAPQPTSLEKHLANATGPIRIDGSDKFFGLENYGSTCYCNSIIQCLYYSAPFREHVINFPSKDFLNDLHSRQPNGAPPPPPIIPSLNSTTPYPNASSPARKQNAPASPGSGGAKPEENKDSSDYKKRMAIQAGPVLDMTSDNSQAYGMQESLFTSLRDIFEAVIAHKSRIGVVSPHRFLEILRRENEMFRSAMHQDAHEFLNLLLNQVVDNVESYSKQHPDVGQIQANGGAPDKLESQSPHSLDSPTASRSTLDAHWVHDLFEGLLTSETRCLTCETTSQRDEAFLDLSVDLSPHTSVTSCLRKFSMEEMLCERNKFHCDTCGGLQEAEKRMKVKRLPRILALHLKRFKYTEDLQRLQKLFHRVVYPFFLRLFNTTDDAQDSDRVYELYAVVVHIGGGPYHGHYVSIIKTKDRGWLLFDDELVEPVDKNYVMNFFGGEPIPGLQDAKQLACAYVLFYQQTTEEAMDMELAADGQLAVTQAVEVDAGKDGLSPLRNGIDNHPLDHVVSPIAEETDHMDPLTHANTAPIPDLAVKSPLDLVSTTPINPVLPSKTKKELKQEEKDRKAREKADLKAEIKALDDKRRALTAKRVEHLRKQQDELSSAVEASKQSLAAEESKRRTEEGGLAGRETGLARFRPGSMSLRGRPKLFGKEKDVPKVPLLPLSSQENGEAPLSPGTNAGSDGEGTTTALPLANPALTSLKDEEVKGKKNRFSLGRKRSTLLS